MRIMRELNMDDAMNYETKTDLLDKLHNVRIKRNPKYLCFRCEHAVVIRRETEPAPKIMCHVVNEWLPDTVVECSKFQALGTLSIWDLAKLAKVIDAEPEKKMGFIDK